jgi:hypothetical protein
MLSGSLPPDLDAVKRLCQLETFTFGKALISFSEEIAPFAGKVAHLAVMAA